MPKSPVQINSDEVADFLKQLSEIGATKKNGMSRLAYSPEWVGAMDLCSDWAKKAGLEVRTDAVGNLWARLKGLDDTSSIVTGSHIDSQHNGGCFDGALGAIGGILALKAIRNQFGVPKKTLEAVVLCEEEASRFPSAGFWGSRAIVGKISKNDLETVKTFDGEPISDIMREINLNPDDIPKAKRNDIDVFIELHIEQGPILEDAGIPVAIVNAITGVAHFEITLSGSQNHAGAFPMDLRRDPMAGFAEITTKLIDHAHRLGRPAVTTVGRCQVDPGGPAVIPSKVTFSIDARHPNVALRKELYKVHRNIIKEVATRRNLKYSIKKMIDLEPCQSDPELVSTLKLAAKSQGIGALIMPSGAGHDTQQMSKISRTAMVFVRSKDGRSHTPEEYSSLSDCTAGIRVLAEALKTLAY
jgi:allantoate deiminase